MESRFLESRKHIHSLSTGELGPNYAINPTPELYLRSSRALLPARVIAALGVKMSTRLLQIHEYLDILNGGVTPSSLSTEDETLCLKEAATIWPDTGLEVWNARERRIKSVYRSHDGRLLCHVNTHRPNAFVICIVEPESFSLKSFFLFDIGAQYTNAVYVCPLADYEGTPTPELIEETIPNLSKSLDPWAVLEVGAGTYLQTHCNPDGSYSLEHQLMTTACHYRSSTSLTVAVVLEAFRSYAFGKYEWTTLVAWEKQEL